MRKMITIPAGVVAAAFLMTACEFNARTEGNNYGLDVYRTLAPDPLKPHLADDDWTLAKLKCSSRAKSWNPDDPQDERAFKRACLESVLDEEGVAVERLEDARRVPNPR